MSIGDYIYETPKGDSQSDKPASIALGIVAENWDAKHPGMIKVNILVSGNKQVLSDWMPVAMPYCSNGSGLYMLPEVGSTVVVAYVDDRTIDPIVIGSIWSSQGKSKSKLPQKTANKDNDIKVFTTPKGFSIKIDEGSKTPSIEMVTPKKQRVFLDDKNEKITLTSGGDDTGIEIDGKSGNIIIKAKKSIVLKPGNKEVVKVTSSSADIKTEKVNVDASQLQLKGKQSKLEGSTVDIKAQGNLKIESSGMAQVKGSMLKLN